MEVVGFLFVLLWASFFMVGWFVPRLIGEFLAGHGEKKERKRCADLVRAALKIPRDLETHVVLHNLLLKIDPSLDAS